MPRSPASPVCLRHAYLPRSVRRAYASLTMLTFESTSWRIARERPQC